MLRNGTYRSMYQGEEARLRSGSLARERKHLALCINSQEEVKRFHRYCNHSGGQAVSKVERSRLRRSEEEDDNSPHRHEQQQHLEIKAIVIQRAWRASVNRRASWHGQGKNRSSHHLDETVPPKSLPDPVMTTDISPGLVLLFSQSHTQIGCILMASNNEIPGGERSRIKSRGGQQKREKETLPCSGQPIPRHPEYPECQGEMTYRSPIHLFVSLRHSHSPRSCRLSEWPPWGSSPDISLPSFISLFRSNFLSTLSSGTGGH
ncbi:hypothetical protein PAMA_020401 [Pampus argenteus]